MTKVVERFLNYVSFDTQSDEETGVTPSTPGQMILANHIAKELKTIGLTDVSVDQNGYVMGTLASNTDKPIPTIGFIAHMDTAPDMSGKDIKPQIVKNYDGKDIMLNKDLNIILSPNEFPDLNNYVGKTLITTDGTTLLGADDKAGVSEIITAVEYLINNPEIPHGTIKVGFTPDEEIGAGADHFDVDKFNAEFAYTVDGGTIGELECENFNAADAKIVIKGRNVHPGSAKNKMVNSIFLGNEFAAMLPSNQVPELTCGYEGFYHLISFNGSVEETKLHYIIRDFDKNKFETKKQKLREIVEVLRNKHGKNIIDLDMKDQYYNMKEKIEPVKHIVNTAFKAMQESGVTPTVVPIRGGTDGARLSFMGLPTPNLFTGGENFHGKYEYVVVESMEKSVEVIINIIKLYTNK